MALISLKQSSSDYNPLLLKLVQIEYWGTKPFICYDAWFSLRDCEEWRELSEVLLNIKLKGLDMWYGEFEEEG